MSANLTSPLKSPAYAGCVLPTPIFPTATTPSKFDVGATSKPYSAKVFPIATLFVSASATSVSVPTSRPFSIANFLLIAAI